LLKPIFPNLEINEKIIQYQISISYVQQIFSVVRSLVNHQYAITISRKAIYQGTCPILEVPVLDTSNSVAVQFVRNKNLPNANQNILMSMTNVSILHSNKIEGSRKSNVNNCKFVKVSME
jgi:hypothetical protein